MNMVNYDPHNPNLITPPEEERKPDEKCAICDKSLYEGDALYTVDGGICLECLEDEYKMIL